MLIYGQINIEYSFVINAMTLIGTILGIRLMGEIVRRSNGR